MTIDYSWINNRISKESKEGLSKFFSENELKYLESIEKDEPRRKQVEKKINKIRYTYTTKKEENQFIPEYVSKEVSINEARNMLSTSDFVTAIHGAVKKNGYGCKVKDSNGKKIGYMSFDLMSETTKLKNF